MPVGDSEIGHCSATKARPSGVRLPRTMPPSGLRSRAQRRLTRRCRPSRPSCDEKTKLPGRIQRQHSATNSAAKRKSRYSMSLIRSFDSRGRASAEDAAKEAGEGPADRDDADDDRLAELPEKA